MLINLETQDALKLCMEQCKSDLMNYSNYQAIMSQKAGLITDRHTRCSYIESETTSSPCNLLVSSLRYQRTVRVHYWISVTRHSVHSQHVQHLQYLRMQQGKCAQSKAVKVDQDVQYCSHINCTAPNNTSLTQFWSCIKLQTCNNT